uniref:Actin maturation protease n=1 Tax=Geotrypetes seraphini TaxID=260995 RepID=A0A6P8RZH4_GEOSA|nr:UPF0692 protein C19orf54 homolog [Geotrypetes seraphini]
MSETSDQLVVWPKVNATRNAPLPPAPPPPPLPSFETERKKFFKMVADRSASDVGGCQDVKKLLKNRQDSFNRELQWLLFYKHVPSLIQEGPQCGLVALWMAGPLLQFKASISIEEIVQVALERGYTAQGEMFSATHMACLAEEVFCCRAELLEGMDGKNQWKLLHHLTAGHPALVPYDEDCNHEPCMRSGHRAHWAIITGVLFGLKGRPRSKVYKEDPDITGLFYPHADSPPPCIPEIAEVYLLAKQGKSLRYQLWEYGTVSASNRQLVNFDPKRSADGKVYVLPEGGVKTGLCGKLVLLHPRTTADPHL